MIETLAALSNDPQIIGRLNEISDRLDALKLQPWVTGLIGVLAAGLTAFLSARGSLVSQRKDRRNKGQRDAIHGAQDALEALLKRWAEVKDWQKSSVSGDSPLPTHKELQLMTSFEKHVSRIKNESLRTAFNEWKEKGRLHFHGYEEKDGAPGVDYREERDLRQRAYKLAGEEVIRLD